MANVLDRINRTTRRQRGGYALMGGGLVALVVGLIEPGGVLVNSTDRLDFAGRVDVMADHAALTHFTSIFVAMALVTIIAGLMVVWNTAHEEGLDCTATRYGLMMAGLGTGALILGEGIDQMMVIAVNDGLGGVFAAGSDEVMQVAVSMHSIKAGIAIVALPLVMLGASSVSIGLRPILPAGLQRAAALVCLRCRCGMGGPVLGDRLDLRLRGVERHHRHRGRHRPDLANDAGPHDAVRHNRPPQQHFGQRVAASTGWQPRFGGAAAGVKPWAAAAASR